MAHRNDGRDRRRGCLLGLALGDAVGAPFEGRTRVQRTAVEQVADGEQALRWTDDTHMAIGLAQSLIDRGGLDGPHLAATFADNYRAQPWRGYGAGPPQVFAALDAGAAWDEPATRLFGGQGSFGNGAAMRVAPIGLVAPRGSDQLRRLARDSARVTHAHELGQQAAVLQAGVVAWLLEARPHPGWDQGPGLIDHARGLAPSVEFQRRLDRIAHLDPTAALEQIATAVGTGIAAVEAVPAALAVFLRHPLSLREAIVDAVSLGGDTDTIAAMTGALSGAFLGAGAVPLHWRARLEAAEDLERLADALAAPARSAP